MSELHLLLAFASPAYPVGGFAYSHGLEAAIAAGEVRDAADVASWIGDVIGAGAGRTDAILLVAAMRAEGAALDALADLAAALATSRERHLETTAQGAAFAEVTAAVHGTDGVARPYPVAVGAAGRALGLSERALAAAYLHAFAANLVSAAVRFLPLGQTAGQRVLAGLFPLIDRVAAEALAAEEGDIGTATLAADLAAMRHETMETRIFRT